MSSDSTIKQAATLPSEEDEHLRQAIMKARELIAPLQVRTSQREGKEANEP